MLRIVWVAFDFTLTEATGQTQMTRHRKLFATACVGSLLAGCQTLDSVTETVSSSFESIRSSLAGEDQAKNSSDARQLEVTSTVTPEQVVDGDTIRFGESHVRLFGMDAPELRQVCELRDASSPCGELSKQVLIGFVAGASVRCVRRDVDRYGRDVSQCFADGTDISAAMVRSGHAVAYRRFSTDYVSDEDIARSEKRGMWKGKFVMPWDWRAGLR
ncbi:MAG: thermonuclease family protein [Limisphaerales bacterium]